MRRMPEKRAQLGFLCQWPLLRVRVKTIGIGRTGDGDELNVAVYHSEYSGSDGSSITHTGQF